MTDLRARLTALRDALRAADEDWAATEIDAILASLPAEPEPIEMPNLRQPLETSAAESWRVERVRQQTASAADPKRQQAEPEPRDFASWAEKRRHTLQCKRVSPPTIKMFPGDVVYDPNEECTCGAAPPRRRSNQ